jgi:hypothetical protein
MEPTQECKLYKGCGLSARPRTRARKRAPANARPQTRARTAHLPCACCRLSLVNLRLLVGADSRDPTVGRKKIFSR